MVGDEQAHDDARGAETALRAVQVDHRLLHRMERVAVGEILDGDEFDAVELAEQQNAGVDRLVAQPPARDHAQKGPDRHVADIVLAGGGLAVEGRGIPQGFVAQRPDDAPARQHQPRQIGQGIPAQFQGSQMQQHRIDLGIGKGGQRHAGLKTQRFGACVNPHHRSSGPRS